MERAEFAVETVLAPVDGTEESAAAVEYAVAIADRYDATVHALYVLGRGVVRGLDAGTVDEDEVAETARVFLREIEEFGAERDVPVSTSTTQGFSPTIKTRHPGSVVLDSADAVDAPTIKTRHPGSVVLDSADAVDADFIVLPRESATDAPEVLERAAEYVLAYASQPVLSV